MYFDRWDICAAYNMYAVLWNGDEPAYSYGCRLSRIKYRPSASEQTLDGLSANAKEIYGSLVRKHETLFTAYERLARKRNANVPPWPGTFNVPNIREWLKSEGLLSAVESMVQ